MSICPNKFVKELKAYVPGEQPQDTRIIKLNTNENPYPPSPAVSAALRDLADNGTLLNKYPDPWARELCRQYGKFIGFSEKNMIAGNGSDEILRMIFEAFTDPGQSIAVLSPTYTLYETLADMFGCSTQRFYYGKDDKFDLPEEFATAKCKLLFLPNPNPPYGILVTKDEVRRLVEFDPSRLVVIDEAYIDFSGDPRGALDFAEKYDNAIVTRTFSKSWSMAGARLGFACTSPDLFAYLAKVKDSYNVNRLTQVTAVAALSDAAYQKKNNDAIIALRPKVVERLTAYGFTVTPSMGNFVFARGNDAPRLYLWLKENKILVRWFDTPLLRDGVRITIGTPAEMDALMSAIDRYLKG